MPLKTRFAPTPSGFLHAGNGISFILTWALARATDGKILLRIDDLDAERMRPEYVEDIFRTIDWLGLDYDEGPINVEDFNKNYSQHLRLDLYNHALNRLVTEGGVYACNCSRKTIKEQSKNGLYPNICRDKNLPFDLPETAWRVRVNQGQLIDFQDFKSGKTTISLSETMGDFIVKQKNNYPAYQLASVVDDLYFKVNFIVRGMDLLNSTAAQIFLAEKLHEVDFKNIIFYHHPLITNDKNEKLSKSKGADALKTWREEDHTPSVLIRQAAQWLGIAEPIDTLPRLLEYTKDILKK